MPAIRWEPNEGTGLRTGYWVDHATGQLTIVRRDDTDVVARHNKIIRETNNNDQRRRSGQMYPIANISPGVYMQWRQLYGVDLFNRDHFKAVLRLIDSPEWNSTVAVANGKFSSTQERTHFIGARAKTDHPLATNRASVAPSGGLIDTGAWRV